MRLQEAMADIAGRSSLPCIGKDRLRSICRPSQDITAPTRGTLTSVISDKLRFCGTVTQDENGGLTQIFIQNVGSVEGKGDAFQIGEDGQLALGDRHLLGSASYPKGLQVTAFTLRYDASTDIFSVTLEIGDRSRQTLSQTSFDVNRINRTVT